jgi:type IV pilus assembly protein PilV
MSQRLTISRSARPKGFTLVETVVALAVLAIGLTGVAAMIGNTLRSGTRARYMNVANVLASEKLDNLNQWPSTEVNGTVVADANVAPGGSLNGPVVCANTDQYCDMVTVNEASGADYETQTAMVPNGAGGYTAQTTTIVHTSSGCVDTPANCGVGAPPTGGSTFTRRWLITWNPTILTSGGTATAAGVRQITVVVTLNDATFSPPVSFQMSMVRP